MIKNLFAKLGKGGAAVDLQLTDSTCAIGEMVEGELKITGGSIPQSVTSLSVKLTIEYVMNGHAHRQTIADIPINQFFKVEEGEEKSFPFSYRLPLTLPLSCFSISYQLQTHLKIEGAVDANDMDPINIKGPDALLQVFYAMGALGFRENEQSGDLNGSVQSFVFSPFVLLKDKISHIELQAAMEREGIRLRILLECSKGQLKWSELFLAYAELQNRKYVEETLKSVFHDLLRSSNSLGSAPKLADGVGSIINGAMSDVASN